MVNRFNWTSCEIMLTKHIYLIPGHTENIFGKHHFYLSPIKDKQTISKDLDFGKIVKRRININYKIINIAFELCLLRTSAFGHLSTWPGLGNSSRPFSLSFHCLKSIFHFQRRIGNKAERSRDLLMQSMTDRRTEDRSEWENCPDITEIFTQDIFRNTE